MKQGIQTLMQEAGESACYALAISEIAERVTKKPVDIIGAFNKAFDKGYIYYNYKNAQDNDNFFVKDPAGFLAMLAGGKWTLERADDPAYKPKPGEWAVERWERSATGKLYGHFRLPDWDSLADSQTVKYGRIVSKRVFRRSE